MTMIRNREAAFKYNFTFSLFSPLLSLFSLPPPHTHTMTTDTTYNDTKRQITEKEMDRDKETQIQRETEAERRQTGTNKFKASNEYQGNGMP